MDSQTKAQFFQQGGQILSDLARALIARPPAPRKEPETSSTFLRYDPSTNRYNGQKLTRGDVLKGVDGTEYTLDRANGFILMLDKKSLKGGTDTISISVDPFDTDRYLSVRPTGENRYGAIENKTIPMHMRSSSIALPTSDETTTELKRRLAKELYRMELDLAAGLKIAGKPCDCGSNKHTLMLEAAAEELISQDPDNAFVYQSIIVWIRNNSSKIVPEAILSGKYDSDYPRMANEFKMFRKNVLGSVADPVAHAPGEITLEEAKRLAAEEASAEVERQWKKES